MTSGIYALDSTTSQIREAAGEERHRDFLLMAAERCEKAVDALDTEPGAPSQNSLQSACRGNDRDEKRRR